MNKKLAKVEGYFFGIEDHGILTMDITLDYGNGGHQTFGGIALDSYSKKKERRVGHASGTDFILRILDLFEVNELKEIIGKTVYALLNDKVNATIIGLEMPEFASGERFVIKEWQEEMKE